MTVYRNDKGRFREPTALERNVDIRKGEDVGKLESMLKNGGITFVLIYADWCGHCHRYLPTWADLEKTPGRTANMARVHYDMQEKIPSIASAKIQGYPSVVKVKPDGSLESYTPEGSGEATNAIPMMRDTDAMTRELTSGSSSQSGGGLVGGLVGGAAPVTATQEGGSVVDAFVAAVKAAGPAALLLATYSGLQSRRVRRGASNKSFKSHKRTSRTTRRAVSRRNRSFRRRRNYA